MKNTHCLGPIASQLTFAEALHSGAPSMQVVKRRSMAALLRSLAAVMMHDVADGTFTYGDANALDSLADELLREGS